MTALALCLALTTAGAQEAQEGSNQNGVPLVRMADLEMVHYVPKHESVNALAQFLVRNVGREVMLEERGPRSRAIQTITQLGGTIVLYDKPEQNRRVLEIVARIDVPAEEEAEPEEFVTRRYTLRYLAPEQAQRALEPMQSSDADFTVLEDRRAVSLMGSPRGVAELEALLKEFDVPEDQFRIQVLLVRGVPDLNPDPARVTDLPQELFRSLADMLPRFHFSSIGTALLQTSATSGRDVELSISSAEDSTAFDFRFRPVAYDANSGDLSVEKCELRARNDVRVPADPAVFKDGEVSRTRTQQIFSTSTILGGGEYTVIGGAGAEPVFAVVRVTPVR